MASKKKIVAKKAVITKKVSLPAVPDQAPVVSKSKGKLPEIVSKKAEPKLIKKIEKELSERLYLNNPIIDEETINVVTVPMKAGKSTDFCKLYKTGMTIAEAKAAGVPASYIKFHIYRGFIAYNDAKIKVFVGERKASSEKKPKAEKGAKIKLAIASLKK